MGRCSFLLGPHCTRAPIVFLSSIDPSLLLALSILQSNKYFLAFPRTGIRLLMEGGITCSLCEVPYGSQLKWSGPCKQTNQMKKHGLRRQMGNKGKKGTRPCVLPCLTATTHGNHSKQTTTTFFPCLPLLCLFLSMQDEKKSEKKKRAPKMTGEGVSKNEVVKLHSRVS